MGTLFKGHTYTFKKDASDLILLDSTDHSHETITFRDAIVVSGSSPLTIKPGVVGRGINLKSHNNGDTVASLLSYHSSAEGEPYGFFRLNYANQQKILLTTDIDAANSLYVKGGTDSNSQNLMLLENNSGKNILKVRKDGKIFTAGGDFYVSDTDNNTDNVRLHISSDNGYFDYNFGGDMHFRQGTTTRMELDGSAGLTQHWRPMADNAYNLGTTTKRWDAIYAVDTSVNSSSDERLKKEITDSNLGLSFINRLRPVSFKWKKNGIRPHYGLIAQEVSSSLAEEGIHTDDFGGYVSDDVYTKVVQKPDPEDTSTLIDVTKVYSKSDLTSDGITDLSDYTFVSSSLGLRYGEFTSPLIKAVQELAAEVTSLKARVTELENN